MVLQTVLELKKVLSIHLVVALIFNITEIPKEKLVLIDQYIQRNVKLASLTPSDTLGSFVDKDLFSDVTLRTRDGGEVRAHKIVLAAKSKYDTLHSSLTVFSVS